MTMNRTAIACAVVLLAGPAVVLAVQAKTKEEAQAQIDAGMAKSCEISKKQILAKKDVCAEEAAKVEAVDCAKKESRKSVDLLALNSSCASKQRGAAKDTTAKSTKATSETASTDKAAPAATATHCKALDEAGKVVAELDAPGSTYKCRSEMRAKLKAEKCAGKALSYSFIASQGGKDERPSTITITCPAQ